MFFFLFRVVYKNFFTNPVVIENARLQLALIIPTGALITVANDAIEMLLVAADKRIDDLSKNTQEPKNHIFHRNACSRRKRTCLVNHTCFD